jgi:hypothetical protein
MVGWAELAVAALVALRPSVPLLFLVAGWKVATEALFLAAGSPVWEFVERAGSYAAPLALAALIATRGRLVPHVQRQAATADPAPAGLAQTSYLRGASGAAFVGDDHA